MLFNPYPQPTTSQSIFPYYPPLSYFPLFFPLACFLFSFIFIQYTAYKPFLLLYRCMKINEKLRLHFREERKVKGWGICVYRKSEGKNAF